MCEEFDLEKVLKQITPEGQGNVHETAGEFGRFRRSRILSASEEKSLIDESNNFDENGDEDELASLRGTGSKDEADKSAIGDDAGKENITVGSKRSGKEEISKKSSKEDDSSKTARSDIVMFSQKPVDKASPSINETSSVIDFAKVAKEIPATNDTKVNRRYEVPREESGSGSGARFQSGSGSATDDVPVSKSKITRKRAYKQEEKHSDISVNEAALMSHMNSVSSVSGSGSGSDDDDDAESGSGAQVASRSKIQKTGSNYVKVTHDSGKAEEQHGDHYFAKLSNSTSEISLDSLSSTTSNDSKTGSKRTIPDATKTVNVTLPQVAQVNATTPTTNETTVGNATASVSNASAVTTNQTATPVAADAAPSNTSVLPLTATTTAVSNATAPATNASAPQVNTSSAAPSTRTVLPNVTGPAAPPTNQSAQISTNNTKQYIDVTATKYAPSPVKDVVNETTVMTNASFQKKEEISSNVTKITQNDTGAVNNNLESALNATMAGYVDILNASANTKSANLTNANDFSADFNPMLQTMSNPSATVQNLSKAPNNAELIENGDEIMSYVNLTNRDGIDKTNAAAEIANITISKMNASDLTAKVGSSPQANLLAAGSGSLMANNLIEQSKYMPIPINSSLTSKVNFMSDNKLNPELKMLANGGEDQLSQEASKLFDFENNEAAWGDFTNDYQSKKAAKMMIPSGIDMDDDLPGSRGGGLNEEDLQALQQKSPDRLKATEVDDDIMSAADLKQRDNIPSQNGAEAEAQRKSDIITENSSLLNAAAAVPQTIKENATTSKKDGVEMQIESTIKSSFEDSIKNIAGNQSLGNDLLPGDYGDETPLLIENESGSGSGQQDSSSEMFSSSGSGESESEVNMLLKAVANNRNANSAKSEISAPGGNSTTMVTGTQEVFSNNTGGSTGSGTSEGSAEEYLSSGEYISESGSGSAGASGDVDFELSPEYEGNANSNALKVSSVGSAILEPKSDASLTPTISRISPISFYSNATTTTKPIDTTASSLVEDTVSSTSDEDSAKLESGSGSASGSESVMEKLNEIVNDNEKVSAAPALDDENLEAESESAAEASPSSKPTTESRTTKKASVSSTTTEASTTTTTTPTSKSTIHKKQKKQKHKKKLVAKEKIAGMFSFIHKRKLYRFYFKFHLANRDCLRAYSRHPNRQEAK